MRHNAKKKKQFIFSVPARFLFQGRLHFSFVSLKCILKVENKNYFKPSSILLRFSC